MTAALLPLNPDPAPPKTRSDLDYDRVLAAVAERSTSEAGQALARMLPFAATREEARARLQQAREAVTFLAAGEPLPVGSVPDAREALGRVRVGGVLAGAELRATAEMLAAARGLRRFLAARKTRCPALVDACTTDPTLDGLADEIAGCFELDGALADRASPRLKELRAEYYAARQRMLSRLDDLMRRYERILSDRFVTEREGRYVLPVRSDAHERFPGIVHATSASGGTLFVEPRAVIPMGNRLKVLEADVQREEIAVFTRLTTLVADSLPSVEACVDALAVADVRAATARLAQDIFLAFPRVVDEPALDLREARHPLLALDPTCSVVASDLAIASGRGMIISGPNAGGKTVALKTMGLVALMVRAGLPVPCDEESTVGLFDVVLTDVGDDQSLQKNLSTFSAHVRNLASILSETSRGALVLLDELAGGTDPREGESLAAGVLDALSTRGGAVAATTHYEGLKALAVGDDRFVNASVGLDLATMTPTFRLAIGVPGSSSALAIARRFGMPAGVLERAQRFLSREDQSFESTVRRLNDERAALELARHAAEEREREARTARARFEAELEQARGRERHVLSREGQELMERIRRVREDLRAAQARLRAKRIDEAELKEADRIVARAAAEVAIGGQLERVITQTDETPREPLRSADVRRGMRVFVPRLRAEAEIVDVLTDGSVRVAAGPLKLVVSASDLRAGTPEPPASKRALPSPAGRREPANAPLETAIPTGDNSCDLRGLRADDAVSLATTFLDRSINANRPVAFLVHGHGTGALREAIRRELRESPYVAHFRAGNTDEGGDGVTVVWLQ